jgi:hypothetical protein
MEKENICGGQKKSAFVRPPKQAILLKNSWGDCMQPLYAYFRVARHPGTAPSQDLWAKPGAVDAGCAPATAEAAERAHGLCANLYFSGITGAGHLHSRFHFLGRRGVGYKAASVPPAEFANVDGVRSRGHVARLRRQHIRVGTPA